LDFRAEFRIVAGFRAAQTAVGNVKVERGMRGHAPEKWTHVLNRMRGHCKDTIPAVRHDVFP
jgi:hypothetical protein